MSIYPASHLPGRKVILNNGQEYLWFSGTDYLGMGHHEGFLAFLREGISIYGTHFGSSRNNSLRLDIYEQAELALTQFSGASAALTTSSGIWAGQLLIKELPAVISGFSKGRNPFPKIHHHYAPRVHPALWGPSFASSQISWADWAKNTVSEIQESNHDDFHVILTDSVGSPFVENFDFSLFNTLPFYRQILLIVDDSHGLGIIGKSGNGIYSELAAIQQVKLIVVSSLNKAMGIPGGVIFADEDIITTIRQSPFFSGASPTAPAYMFALDKLLESNAYKAAYDQLQNNIGQVCDSLAETNLFVSKKGYPVFCSLDVYLFDFLQDHGIMPSCFSYPKATDPAVTRLVISAIHQKEDLDRLAEVCLKF